MKALKLCRFLLAASVFAASLTAASADSPLSLATDGLFTTESDDIQSVTYFSEVPFDSWFAASNFQAESLDLGGAFKVGSLIISPWYTGSLINGFTDKRKTSTAQDILDATDTFVTAVLVTDEEDNSSEVTMENTFTLLLGLPDLGAIRLGYTDAGTSIHKGTYFMDPDSIYSSETSETTTVTLAGGGVVSQQRKYYDPDGEWGNTSYYTSIEAGTNLVLGDFILKPAVSFGLGLRNAFIHTSFTESGTPGGAGTVATHSYDGDNKTTELHPALSLTLLLPETASGLRHGLYAYWAGQYNFYNDWDSRAKYSYTMYETTGGYEKEVYSSSCGPLRKDQSYSKNTFELSYLAYKDISQGLTLAGQADITCFYSTHKYKDEVGGDSYWVRYSSTATIQEIQKNSSISNTSEKYTDDTYAFVPKISGAVCYAVNPKFQFMAGATIVLPGFSASRRTSTHPDSTVTIIEETDYDGSTSRTTLIEPRNGTVTDSTENLSNWNDIDGHVYIGCNWMLSDNFSIQSALELGFGDSYAPVFNNSLQIGALLKY